MSDEELLRQLEISDRLRAITQKVGFAVWQLQELEGIAAIAYVLLEKAESGMGMEAGKAILEKALAKTFGQMVRDIVKARILGPDFNARLLGLVEQRNWLVHRSKADSRTAVLGDAAAKQLLKRLEGLIAETAALTKQFGIVVENHPKMRRVPRQEAADEAARTLERWHRGEGDGRF